MLRYKQLLILLLTAMSGGTSAQELFVYSEPASNMPAHSTGIRLTNMFMNEPSTGKVNYHFFPEVMWGANRNLMLHAEGFFSNREGRFSAEGVGAYAKYRFLSTDNVFRHFRMAAFARATTNNSHIHQEAIQTNGFNTGYQAGVVATQLLHKTALSLTGYYEQATNNGRGNELIATMPDKALNYIASAGHLVLPAHYRSYKQVNMNIMAELIGQLLPQSGQQYVDIAPSLQFIFQSQLRLDIGYRHELYSTMLRPASNGLLIRFEYLMFNTTGRKPKAQTP